MQWTVHCGSALDVLKTLPDESVHCVVTSPPYYGLRNYGVDGQLGLEPTPAEFVAALMAVCQEVRRVLRADGVLFLNLGDSYAASGPAGGAGKQYTNKGTIDVPVRSAPLGTKPKDLLGVPWSAAFALREAGWYLRSDIIWHKPNPMPESVIDRPTKAHEYVFLLSKSARYYWNQDAIREKYAESTLREFQQGYDGEATKDYAGAGVQNPSDIKARIVAKARKTGGNFSKRYAEAQPGHGAMALERPIYEQGANARSVWSINTEPSPYDHFAVMPKALARRCIMAGTPPGGTVLDPFSGMATTGTVALEEGRSYIGIELNPKYAEASRRRLADVAPLLATEVSA